MELPTITLVLPTIGRPTLARALASLQNQDWHPGDEVLVVGDGPCPAARAVLDLFQLPSRYLETPTRLGGWGHGIRNWVNNTGAARGSLLIGLDDDDALAPDAVATVRRVAVAYPERPLMFRMRYERSGKEMWTRRSIELGEVGTPMFVAPNNGKLAPWPLYYGGDKAYIADTVALYPADALVWREEIIAIIMPWRQEAGTPIKSRGPAATDAS